MSIKGTRRKTAGEFTVEHELFLELVAEKRPELEIVRILELSKVQMQQHTLIALQKQEVSPDDLKPDYEATYAKGLPRAVRKLMSLDSEDDADALVKVEVQDGGVLLTLLRTDLPRQEQSVTEDPQEAAMESTKQESV